MPRLPRRTFLFFAGALVAARAPAQATASLQSFERLLNETAGTAVLPYSTRDFGRKHYPAGRSVRVPEASAESMLAQVRSKLPPGWIAWVGVTHDLSHSTPAGVELAAAPGQDQFDILRAAATDGANYGIQTEGIVKELQAWDREFGIDIWQAETDTVQMRLKRLPRDLPAFAKRLYEFCPDIVDQGVGSVDAFAQAIAADKAVLLWWD